MHPQDQIDNVHNSILSGTNSRRGGDRRKHHDMSIDQSDMRQEVMRVRSSASNHRLPPKSGSEVRHNTHSTIAELEEINEL